MSSSTSTHHYQVTTVFNAYWLGAQLYHELRMNSLAPGAGNSFGSMPTRGVK